MYSLLDKNKTYFAQGGGIRYIPETQNCGAKEKHLSEEFSWVLNDEIHPIVVVKNGVLMTIAILEDMAERYAIDTTGKDAETILAEVNVAIEEEAQAMAEEQANAISDETRSADALQDLVAIELAKLEM